MKAFSAINLTTILAALCLTGCVHAAPASTPVPQANFWKYQCVDTVKDSRDSARSWAGRSDLQSLVNAEVAAIKNMGANCVAIGTPYDPEFVPYMKVWVDAIHQQGMAVWFRGNLSGWEGWFNYPILSSVSQHHQKIAAFITGNPSLFQNGDLFTPAPEPENGKVIGDPRQSAGQKQQYLKFLVDSYNNCVSSFAKINKQVDCGTFSTNGDIAKDILTPAVVKQIGNVVVVDHYVADPNQLVSDLLALHTEFNAPIILGEFGAPIPDLNGSMTQAQQADYINTVLAGLAQHSDIIEGVNYWTLTNSSTAVLNDDNSPRTAVATIKNFYLPGTVSGTAADVYGNALPNVSVWVQGSTAKVTTDSSGHFSLPAPPGQVEILAQTGNYDPTFAWVKVTGGGQATTTLILAQQANSGFWSDMKQFFKNIFVW